MAAYRDNLPQLDCGLYLTDAGLETDFIFNRGIDLPHFASHTLLATGQGRAALAQYFRQFLDLAGRLGAGFVLDAPTWRAHSFWARTLESSIEELRSVNREAVGFVADLCDEFAGSQSPILLNAVIGPVGDAYRPEVGFTASEARDYHGEQLRWLAGTEVDMVSALTFHEVPEAIGFVRAAGDAGLPAVVSFTTETDGRLPSGVPLREAVLRVDEATEKAAAYFMINCAHPDHFRHALDGSDWTQRIRGLRCNASRCSHAELDDAETLDAGDPQELAASYAELIDAMPWINVLGGCCGSDFRHVAAIAGAVLDAGSEERRRAS